MKRIDKCIVAPIVIIVVAILSMFMVHGHYAQARQMPGMPDTIVIAKNAFSPGFVEGLVYSHGTFGCMYFDPEMTFEPTVVSMDKYTFKALLSVMTTLDECEPFSDEYNAVLEYFQFTLWINLGSGEYSLTLPKGQLICGD